MSRGVAILRLHYILLSGHGEMRRRRVAHASRLRTLAIPGQYLGALARPRGRTCRRRLLAAAAAALLREQRALRYTHTVCGVCAWPSRMQKAYSKRPNR